ncbi:MAG: hypothetical protein AMJ54_04995 [Deltaproteobacteria bacterium SG8_13]|nr:MAG: hypothetical protein AMJ54_04995 [Deltaproteobacteria bacterium SG8_13]
MKTVLWLTAVLLALAVAFLLASGRIGHGVRPTVSEEPKSPPSIRHKIPDADRPTETGDGGKKTGPADPIGGVTRTYVKPSYSEPTEAVRLEVSAIEQDGELLIVGKLFDGSSCYRMQIDLELQADDGRIVFHTLMLSPTGQNQERPIRSKRRLPPSSTKAPVSWRAHVAALRCLDP